MSAKPPKPRSPAPVKSPPAKAAPRGKEGCLIVGIGASAGGLEAFTQLLAALPPRTGLALVLVPHLDPKHESRLTALLARTTKLPIHEVRDGMRVEPDHVYVIPPNANMAVLHGRLSLIPRTEERGRHLPVDFFFHSLAADQQSRAIGVILSGTASDGTAGLRAIKAAGGLTFAQEKKSARYDGMPHSAIAAGVVDRVLPPDAIARELAQLVRHPYVAQPAPPEESAETASNAELNKIFILLRAASGVDFSLYKPTTLLRRITRRMALQKVNTLATYVRYLKQTPQEVGALFDDVLINVTNFFREPETFHLLKKKVFPQWLPECPPQTPLRIWVPGCSTGEEAYSLAIALVEFLGPRITEVPVQIFASDISKSALQQARSGIYPEGIAADVSPERLRRFFAPHNGGYQISKQIRELCIFARQDVTRDPPFSKLDLVSCRNLLIYFGPVLQKRVLPIFHYALRPGGHLLLGSSETVGGFADLFTAVDHHHKLYARKPAGRRLSVELPPASRAAEVAVPGLAAPVAQSVGFDFQKEADRVVLGRFAPAGVVVNERLDVLQFRGHTGPYLEPAPGTASLNLLKMARGGLLADLRTACNEARRSRAPVVRHGVTVHSDAGGHAISVEVIPLRATPTEHADSYLILFHEAAPSAPAETGPRKSAARKSAPAGSAAPDKALAQLEQELLETKEYLQSVFSEHEGTNEELQSANEEILSSNEELQSTNEEMETAKEELQSTNEELTTINDELQVRNAELFQANGDLVNLLNSVQIPIIILGGDLRIRRFTPLAQRVLNLIPGDIGRPLSDLRPNLLGPDLDDLIAEVMDSLTTREIEVQDREGRWHSLCIRPYKTLQNKIDGVVLALVDIDTGRRALAEARQARDFAEAVIATTRQPLLVLDGKLRVKMANRAFYQLFKVRPEETEKQLIYALGEAQWDIARLRKLLGEILAKKTHFENFTVDIVFPGVGKKKLLLNARRLVGGNPDAPEILLAMEEAVP